MDKPNDLKELQKSEWYKTRPEVIQKAVDALFPAELWMIRSTGHQCHIHSYQEPTSGKLEDVTITVVKTGIALDQEATDKQSEDFRLCRVSGLLLSELSIWGTETEITTDARDLCKDCDKNTMEDPKDYYMVTHELWESKGLGDRKGHLGSSRDMLCMDCMETRIGRKLEYADLLPCPLNEKINPYTKSIISNHLKQ